ncbi:hypothetical protein GCM10022219_14410 [Microbacterium oryzae]|uniref:DUF3137 domain-containing protein n=1 Tax=Microbacterium oryzae TaxID=743009 RepID=A0A6I6E9E2_9MICO|nr:hypothetical protein [Microbacterium oryzae]QGU28231.1 hypothetical protein D7D94_11500 [Microbacterium oryzae]
MSDTTQGVPFDARALTEPVDPADSERFARELAKRYPRMNAGAFVIIVIMLGLAVTGAIITFAFAAAFGGGEPNGANLLALVVAAAIAGVILWAFRTHRRRQRERQYRLDRFARANGMSYVPVVKAPPLPGMIFGVGRERRAWDLVRGDAPRFVEFANYQYTTGSGKHKTTHTWAYVAIRLDAPLPHIVLDALGNNSIFGSNLPVGFDADQRLSLEGDFDRHFALYCPEGYEADALYLFTPDIMARFLDNAGQLDVEIVDDWMFLYTRRRISTLDPATWAWLFSVVGALIGKLDQWGRWRDDRMAVGPRPVAGGVARAFTASAAVAPPEQGVAAPGRRLKRRFSWAGVVGIGIAVVVFLLEVMGNVD